MQYHLRRALASLALVCALLTGSVFASSHREAPITALDRTADVTDWYAFVSFDHPDRVTMILNVDPFLEPSNGPNYFPFDPNVLYEMKVDNNRDGEEDIIFQFRFNTQIRQPGLFTGFVGDLAEDVSWQRACGAHNREAQGKCESLPCGHGRSADFVPGLLSEIVSPKLPTHRQAHRAAG